MAPAAVYATRATTTEHLREGLEDVLQAALALLVPWGVELGLLLLWLLLLLRVAVAAATTARRARRHRRRRRPPPARLVGQSPMPSEAWGDALKGIDADVASSGAALSAPGLEDLDTDSVVALVVVFLAVFAAGVVGAAAAVAFGSATSKSKSF